MEIRNFLKLIITYNIQDDKGRTKKLLRFQTIWWNIIYYKRFHIKERIGYIYIKIYSIDKNVFPKVC